jgi:hypothetical protein
LRVMGTPSDHLCARRQHGDMMLSHATATVHGTEGPRANKHTPAQGHTQQRHRDTHARVHTWPQYKLPSTRICCTRARSRRARACVGCASPSCPQTACATAATPAPPLPHNSTHHPHPRHYHHRHSHLSKAVWSSVRRVCCITRQAA